MSDADLANRMLATMYLLERAHDLEATARDESLEDAVPRSCRPGRPRHPRGDCALLNPSGMCECGCGREAPIAKRNNRALGHIKGEPVRYVAGHQGRWMGPRYDERDCGYETPCWVWLLRCDPRGYGRAGRKLAHRVMYEAANGPVPADLDLHHKCETPACVNPNHLVPLTRAEHAQLNRWATRTHCDYGHPFDEANTYYPPTGGRACRRCVADRQREYQARKAAA